MSEQKVTATAATDWQDVIFDEDYRTGDKVETTVERAKDLEEWGRIKDVKYPKAVAQQEAAKKPS